MFDPRTLYDEGYEVEVDDLLELLKDEYGLESLNLRDYDLDDEDVEAIAKALETNRTLKALDLSSNVFQEDGLKALCRMLDLNKTLTTLYLEYIYISDELPSLVKVLARNTTLKVLSLKNCHLFPDDTEHIAELLGVFCSLEELDLSQNKLTGDLANGLAYNSSLVTLHLSHTKLNDRKIFRALEENRTLQVLDLSDNSLWRNDESLGRLMRTNTTLKTLKLERCHLRHVTFFMKGLEKNKTLQELYIGGNQVSITALARFLSKNKTLKVLDMKGHSIAQEDMNRFARAVVINTSITSLNLSRSIWHYYLKFLEYVLKHNRTLTSLNMSGYGMMENMKLVANGLCENTTLQELNLDQVRILNTDHMKKVFAVNETIYSLPGVTGFSKELERNRIRTTMKKYLPIVINPGAPITDLLHYLDLEASPIVNEEASKLVQLDKEHLNRDVLSIVMAYL